VYFSDRLDGTQYCWRWLLDVERLLQATLAGSVYKTLKQLLETLLKDGKFRRVILVEYPRHGIWAIAFVTGTISNEIQSHLARPMLSVFILPQIPLPVGMQLFRKTRW